MSRVDINGQFSTDNPFSTWNKSEPVKINRESLSSTGNSNVQYKWNEFCDRVDAELPIYEAVRSRMKMWGSAFFILLFGFAILPHILLRLAHFEYKYFLSFFPVIVIIPYFVFIICSWKKLRAVWNNIRQICSEKSGNGIRYELRDEYFGECSKAHARRYYVMVYIDEEQPPTATPVEAIAPVAPVVNATTVPESTPSNTTPFATAQQSAPSNTPPLGGTTSIFDQLNR